MADAAGRFRGGIGVAAVTYGAGAFNLVNAVAGAYAEKSPLVVTRGALAGTSGRGLLLHHQGRTLDTQFRVYEEITCAQARLDDAERAPAETARACWPPRSSSRAWSISSCRATCRARLAPPCRPRSKQPGAT
ncbi:MAG: thiamine pyrophosphate-binding protein [Geminicoccaceae bacterium]